VLANLVILQAACTMRSGQSSLFKRIEIFSSLDHNKQMCIS